MLKFDLQKLPFLSKEIYTLEEVINLTHKNPNQKNIKLEDIYTVVKDFYSNAFNIKAGFYTKEYIMHFNHIYEESFNYLLTCTNIIYNLTNMEQRYFTELKIIPKIVNVEKNIENIIEDNTNENKKTSKNSFKK